MEAANQNRKELHVTSDNLKEQTRKELEETFKLVQAEWRRSNFKIVEKEECLPKE